MDEPLYIPAVAPWNTHMKHGLPSWSGRETRRSFRLRNGLNELA
jgi:hypothetical protein